MTQRKLTPEDLKRIREYESKATKGPWDVFENRAWHTSWLIVDGGGNTLAQFHNWHENSSDRSAEENVHFASQARTDLPRLVEALEEAWEKIEELETDLLLRQDYEQEQRERSEG